MGYKRHDRRKQHVRELDERAEQILAQAAGGATSGAESEGGPPRRQGAHVLLPAGLLPADLPPLPSSCLTPCANAALAAPPWLAGEEEAAASAFVMRELLREEGPFTLLLQTGQVLLAERQHQQAREVLQAALDVCGRR